MARQAGKSNKPITNANQAITALCITSSSLKSYTKPFCYGYYIVRDFNPFPLKYPKKLAEEWSVEQPFQAAQAG
jgi:hypothetical protein